MNMGNLLRMAILGAADDMLGSMGLMRRASMSMLAPGLVCFAAGAVVGGCAALLLTPMTGEEMQDKIEESLRRARERMSTRAKPQDNGKNQRSRSNGQVATAEG
jgi:hypothetical protein